MKFPLFTLFLLSISSAFAAAGVWAPARPSVSDDVLLRAIAQVETGNNPAKVGRYGERTRLQIMPATWRRYSRLPQSARNRAETDRVARAYLAYIRRRLRARRLPESTFYLAAAWNAGPCWHRLRRSTVVYAERVENLVRDYEREDLARAAARPRVGTALTDQQPRMIPLFDVGGEPPSAAPSRQPLQPLNPTG